MVSAECDSEGYTGTGMPEAKMEGFGEETFVLYRFWRGDFVLSRTRR
jgi:hypothetical protein